MPRHLLLALLSLSILTGILTAAHAASYDFTTGIERSHCRQRHWGGRFKLKSIIVSNAKEMVDLTMALFARFRVNGDVAEIFTLDMIT